MKRVVSLAVCCLALSLALACSKKAADSPGPASQAVPAAAPAAAPAPAEAAAPAEPKAVEITDDLVAKYMEYQKANIALAQEFSEQARKNIEAAKGDTVKTLNTISLNEKLSKEMEEKLKAKRQSLGLGDEEFAVVKDGAEQIAAARALYTQMGGDAALTKMEAEGRARIAKLPATERAAAEAQVADMGKSLRDVRDGVELRKKLGDKSADVLLKHADELAKQYWDGLKLMAGKK